MQEIKHDLSTRGGRVAYCLEAAGLDTPFAAAKLGITRQAIYGWINVPNTNIKNDHLFAFADLVGFSARWIATGQGPRKPPSYENPRLVRAMELMESLPEYAVDQAVKTLIRSLNSSPKPPPRPSARKLAEVLPFPRAVELIDRDDQ